MLSAMVFAVLLTVLLSLKFFYPLVLSEVPLGYDVGIYRYLFLKYASALPPFVLPDLPPWAKEHPLGLFILTSPLLKLGLPVDWLIGWVWSLVPFALALTLAWVSGMRWGRGVGILTLLVSLLSIAQFHAFQAMYFKTELALFFMALTFHFLCPLRALPAVLFGVCTVATHHQTGLLLGLVVFTSWVITGVRSGISSPQFRIATLLSASILVLGLLSYLPVWRESIVGNVQAMLQKPAQPGSFPPLSIIVPSSGILLALGAVGFAWSFRQENLGPFHLAVLWSAVFVLAKLFFHRRFFLQLDFFLLPFAALGLSHLWQLQRTGIGRGVIVLLIALQSLASASVITQSRTGIPSETFSAIRELPQHLPEEALVLSLEPNSAPLLLGWLPNQHVTGPGVFSSPWDYEGWKKFLLGTSAERAALLLKLPRPIFLFASPFFFEYYGEQAANVVSDPCVEHTQHPMLLRVAC